MTQRAWTTPCTASIVPLLGANRARAEATPTCVDHPNPAGRAAALASRDAHRHESDSLDSSPIAERLARVRLLDGSGERCLRTQTCASSAVLIEAFVAIEARSRAALLPLRMFRLRTLTGSNLSGLLSGISFVVFFLGSLYAQLVLDYSPVETGTAFLAASLSIVLGAGIAQSLVGRFGVRPVAPTGFVLGALGLVLLAQAPVDGDYFADLFPAFVVFGFGMSFAFIGAQIGSQLGVAPADAGIASGLDQHEPAGRRCDRGRRRDHARCGRYRELRRGAPGNECAQRGSADARIRGDLLRLRCSPRRRRDPVGADPRIQAGGESGRTGRRGRPGARGSLSMLFWTWARQA
jgi:hypothetical protein